MTTFGRKKSIFFTFNITSNIFYFTFTILKPAKIAVINFSRKSVFSFKTLIWLLPLALFPASAFSELETQMLFAKGGWTTELTHDTQDGEFFCSAETTNNRSQAFSIVAYQHGAVALFVFDRSWDIPKRPVRFLVDIDYSRWAMKGEGDGFSVSIEIQESETGTRFLQQLMEGNALAVMNADESRLASFSLSGSYESVVKLLECRDSILQY